MRLINFRPYIAYYVLLIFALANCGKYAPPRAPEAVAPAEIQSLQVLAEVSGVSFKWRASETNASGQELKSMDEYRIYRKELSQASDLLDEEIPYKLLARIEDFHVKKLNELRDASIKAGRPSRRVRVDETLMQFQYIDRDVRPGQSYAYRIVPVNQGGTEGIVTKITKILYRGDTSEIVMIDESNLEESEEVPFE